jgi:hypothetical protein
MNIVNKNLDGLKKNSRNLEIKQNSVKNKSNLNIEISSLNGELFMEDDKN